MLVALSDTLRVCVFILVVLPAMLAENHVGGIAGGSNMIIFEYCTSLEMYRALIGLLEGYVE